VVLGVGQLEGRKGVEDFLDVAQACPDLFFLWAGGRPFGVLTEGIRRLNKRIRASGAHVKFPGTFGSGCCGPARNLQGHSGVHSAVRKSLSQGREHGGVHNSHQADG